VTLYLPTTYATTLSFMIVTMLCWGSWANTLKLCPGYRFQLFYWDYVFGLIGGSVLWGLTLGSFGSRTTFFYVVIHAPLHHVLFALVGGAVFNIANLFLVAAIDIAGLAVAFPIGIGLALVIGAIGNYLINPAGNPWLLFGGIAFVSCAIILDAAAYRKRETGTGKSRRGIVLSLLAGVLMGTFYPLVSKALFSASTPGPYVVSLYFSLGVFICALPLNYFLMLRPLDRRKPIGPSAYFSVPRAFHFWGFLGGIIWCSGATLNFVAAQSKAVGPAVAYALGQGATMVSAVWGVFIWKEFRGSQRDVKSLLALMFVFFLLGLGAVGLSPVWHGH
jgi:glucose uptake protein